MTAFLATLRTGASSFWPVSALLLGSLLPFTVAEGTFWPSSLSESLRLGVPGLILRFPEAGMPALVALAWLMLCLRGNTPPSPRLATGGGIAALGAFLCLLTRAAQPLTTVGSGGLLIVLGSLLLIADGLSRGGIVRGDRFVSGSLLLISTFVLVFILYPVGIVLLRSVQPADGGLSLSLFIETLRGYVPFARVLRNSLLLALVVGVLSPLVGLAFALVTTRSRFGFARLLKSFSLLPIITPPFIVAIAIILLFGLQGTITSSLFGLQTRSVFGFPGLVLAQTLSFAPVAYLVLVGVVESLRPALEEASLTMGASRWMTFRRVTWPLLRPGLANAFLLTIIESLADFGNPMILGGDFEVLATEIYFAVIGRFDATLAAALGVVLLFFTLAAFAAQHFWVGKRSYVTVTGKPSSAAFLPLPRGLDIALTSFCWIWAALTALIYGSVFVGAFVKLWGIDPTFTLDHFRWLAHDGLDALGTTLLLAAISAPITALLGLVLAYLLARHSFRGRRLLEFGAMLSFAVPGTVIGIGYVMAFNESPLLLTGTATILVISFVFRNLPVGLRAGVAALAQIDKALEEASVTLRAGFGATFRRIVLPLVRPALVSALIFSFVRAITAISAVVFLVSPRWNLSTKVILDQAEAGRIGPATAYSTVLIVIMALAIALTHLIVGRAVRGVKLEGLRS